MANVLDKLPTRLQPKAKRALREILYAATMGDAEESFDAFVEEFSPKYERAVACLVKDRERLLSFFDFPAEHWKHLRTTNPIESAFATVRLRQRVTKGAGNRTKGLMMAFKLLAMAQQRWRKLNGAHLLPLVRAGVEFKDGRPLERNGGRHKEAA
jgi:putative transposase